MGKLLVKSINEIKEDLFLELFETKTFDLNLMKKINTYLENVINNGSPNLLK